MTKKILYTFGMLAILFFSSIQINPQPEPPGFNFDNILINPQPEPPGSWI